LSPTRRAAPPRPRRVPRSAGGVPDTFTGIPDTCTGIPDASTGVPEAPGDIPGAFGGVPEPAGEFPGRTGDVPGAANHTENATGDAADSLSRGCYVPRQAREPNPSAGKSSIQEHQAMARSGDIEPNDLKFGAQLATFRTNIGGPCRGAGRNPGCRDPRFQTDPLPSVSAKACGVKSALHFRAAAFACDHPVRRGA